MSGTGALRFADAAELQALVDAFERGEVPAGGFSHQAHLAVALAYLDRYGLDGATQRVREGLLHFLRRALGDDVAAQVKYRETITVFWVRLLAAALADSDPALPLVERVNPLLERFRDSSLIHRYYSAARLDSAAARSTFLEPDLRPLPDAS
ncbi:MAG: hypothetical protein P8Z81_01980 [Deinococcales bacterium]|jgi:hypothetical protein